MLGGTVDLRFASKACTVKIAIPAQSIGGDTSKASATQLAPAYLEKVHPGPTLGSDGAATDAAGD
jgi:hypothetical protein